MLKDLAPIPFLPATRAHHLLPKGRNHHPPPLEPRGAPPGNHHPPLTTHSPPAHPNPPPPRSREAFGPKRSSGAGGWGHRAAGAAAGLRAGQGLGAEAADLRVRSDFWGSVGVWGARISGFLARLPARRLFFVTALGSLFGHGKKQLLWGMLGGGWWQCDACVAFLLGGGSNCKAP